MAQSQSNQRARSRPIRELPIVDERLCTGCGRCVAVCPADCLALAGPLPWLPRPADCIACAACVVLCPPAALTLAPVAA